MTMPDERTRALVMAGDILCEILQLPDASQVLKRQAHVVLRHYPTKNDIDHKIRHIPVIRQWLDHRVS
jgi:hypothetical protein